MGQINENLILKVVILFYIITTIYHLYYISSPKKDRQNKKAIKLYLTSSKRNISICEISIKLNLDYKYCLKLLTELYLKGDINCYFNTNLNKFLYWKC